MASRPKIHAVVVLTDCEACEARGWVPDESQPAKYEALKPCPLCNRSGVSETQLDWEEFLARVQKG